MHIFFLCVFVSLGCDVFVDFSSVWFCVLAFIDFSSVSVCFSATFIMRFSSASQKSFLRRLCLLRVVAGL